MVYVLAYGYDGRTVFPSENANFGRVWARKTWPLTWLYSVLSQSNFSSIKVTGLWEKKKRLIGVIQQECKLPLTDPRDFFLLDLKVRYLYIQIEEDGHYLAFDLRVIL